VAFWVDAAVWKFVEGLGERQELPSLFPSRISEVFRWKEGGEVQIVTRQGEREHVLLCLFCISLSHSFFGILGGSKLSTGGQGRRYLHFAFAFGNLHTRFVQVCWMEDQIVNQGL
jgi:hypothetical protein